MKALPKEKRGVPNNANKMSKTDEGVSIPFQRVGEGVPILFPIYISSLFNVCSSCFPKK